MDESTRKVFLPIYMVLEVIAFTLGISGNLIVIYIVIFKKGLSKTSNKFILSVSIADFLVSIYVVPFGIFKVRNILNDECLIDLTSRNPKI